MGLPDPWVGRRTVETVAVADENRPPLRGHALADRRGAGWVRLGPEVSGTPAPVLTSMVRRHRLLRVLAASGAFIIAACNGDSPDARSTTVPSRNTVAPTTTTTLPPLTYEVQLGDTLSSIAEFFGLSPAVIAMANQLSNADQVAAGQVLTIPPFPPAELTVMPNVAPAGESLTFVLTGAKAGETVTFEINAPNGDKFTGEPHTASQDGVATAGYNSSGDAPGVYTVVATGDRGTSAEAPFLVQG